MRVFVILAFFLSLAGCNYLKPQKGGSASVSSPLEATYTAMGSVAPTSPNSLPNATITQPENPNGSSQQDVSFEKTITVEVPYDTVRKTVTEYPDGRKVTVEEPVPAGTRTTEHVKQGVTQVVGGSWYDSAREIGAKLGSFKGVQYVGIAVLLIGAVGFIHPVARGLIGGKDTALVVGAVGIGMIAGPFLLVEYSKWFFGLIVIAIGYWFISRLKYKEGIADTLQAEK